MKKTELNEILRDEIFKMVAKYNGITTQSDELHYTTKNSNYYFRFQQYGRSFKIQLFHSGDIYLIFKETINGEMKNPVIFSPKYEKELLLLKGDVGGKKVVKKHLDDVFLYEVDNKEELEDFDTLEAIIKKEGESL